MMPSPIMPGLNDSERSLDRVAKAARDAARNLSAAAAFPDAVRAEGLLPVSRKSAARARGAVPSVVRTISYLGDAYKKMLAQRVRKVRDRYGLVSGPADRKPPIWVAAAGRVVR